MRVGFLLVVVAGLVASACWLFWPTAGPVPTGPDAKPGDQHIVHRSETEVWVGHLAEGGEVEFRRSVVPEEQASREPEEEPEVVQSQGRLGPAEKAMAVEGIRNFLHAAEDRFRRAPTGSDEEMVDSLNQALGVMMYEAAIYAVQDDKAWVFAHGEDDEARGVAWRNVPRNWEKILLNNAATTDDGKSLSLIVFVDPAEHPGVQSILDQIQALGKKRSAAGQNK